MRILILTPSILQYLTEQHSPELSTKIRNILDEFKLRFLILNKEDKLPKDWDKYKIETEIVHSTDLFRTLSKMSKAYGNLALFVIAHKLDNALINRYLHTQYSTKLCFLDISEKANDNYRYLNISDEDDTPGLVLHSNGGVYKYRDLTSAKSTPSLRLKVYELPGINVH